MKAKIFIYLFLFLSIGIQAQDKVMDSLQSELKKKQKTTLIKRWF